MFFYQELLPNMRRNNMPIKYL